ncbi:MAG TPA: lipopolysaccharide kinase InaA family protein [Methylomirabilota bacterium]|nr:lipopolysaccharide kinase InaA family protein [Methylomirabilota bacterium]
MPGPDVIHTQPLDDGRVEINLAHAAALERNGFRRFEDFARATSVQVARSFPGRSTVRLELALDHTRLGAYLKRYERGYRSREGAWRRWLGGSATGDEARHEWETLLRLRAAGFPVPQPIAVGRERRRNAARSFLMTEEIPGGQEGDKYLAALPPARRRHLLEAVAGFVARFHAAGFVHRDLYLCHVFVTPAHPGWSLHLIDLQRVARPRWFRRRWIVKDLAALAYSALKSGASSVSLARAFRRYLGRRQLTPADRRLARQILRRVAWLKTRTPKYDTNFTQLR